MQTENCRTGRERAEGGRSVLSHQFPRPRPRPSVPTLPSSLKDPATSRIQTPMLPRGSWPRSHPSSGPRLRPAQFDEVSTPPRSWPHPIFSLEASGSTHLLRPRPGPLLVPAPGPAPGPAGPAHLLSPGAGSWESACRPRR